jgi:[acyl-carrier-protein] S-malonyltransferase
MKLILFPGQGTQTADMNLRLSEENKEYFSKFYNTISQILGYDVVNLTEEELSHTKFAQPAIMACSLANFMLQFGSDNAFGNAQILENCGVAGHSLGEFSAMVASGVLTLEDGFSVIKSRAEAMEKCAENDKNCGMAAVVTKDISAEEIGTICLETPGFVRIANHNSPNQVVISGEKSAISAASETLTQKGARIVPLKTAGAFHTEKMKSAADKFAEFVKNIDFKTPVCPFFSNVTGKVLSENDSIKELAIKHIYSPVFFHNELVFAKENGYNNYSEVPPGKVLTGFAKKIF